MMNILLPAYSRHYNARCGAGLVTAADELENHELEHLVLRERGVVWADQEGAGQLLLTGGKTQAINGVGSAGLNCELAPVLSFSHLLYHQSSPCRKSSHSLYSFVTFWCFGGSIHNFGVASEDLVDETQRVFALTIPFSKDFLGSVYKIKSPMLSFCLKLNMFH